MRNTNLLLLGLLVLSGSCKCSGSKAVDAGAPAPQLNPDTPDAHRLIREADARPFLPGGPLQSEPIPGARSSATYDSLHYFIAGKAQQGLGLGVQWWKPATLELARERFAVLKKASPNAAPAPDVSAEAFRAAGYQNYTVAFVDVPSHSAIAVTCDAQSCALQPDGGVSTESWDRLVTLCRAIAARTGP